MDSPGDTIIIGAPGDNRVYVFDAQNQARTSWTQRSSGWNSNSYLGTSEFRYHTLRFRCRRGR